MVIEGGRVLDETHPPSMGLRLARFLAYITVQSNILVLVCTIPLAREPAYDGRAWRVLRTAAVTGITVTGLVHWFLLHGSVHVGVVCVGIFVLWFALLAGEHAYDRRLRPAPTSVDPAVAVTGS